MSGISSFQSPRCPPRMPSYRRHKPTGQAVVTISGRDVYLGKWNTQASRAEYDRLIGKWLAAGRRMPCAGNDLTVAELASAYLNHAKGYYVKNGKPTGWVVHIKLVLRRLRESYGHTLAVDFGPLAFKALRQTFIKKGHSRGYVNKPVAIVTRMFKWGASEQLVPGSIYQDLRTVEGLRKGRCEAPDHPPVKPVAANGKRWEEAAAVGKEPDLLPNWSPNQLRHRVATEVRAKSGLEASQVVLGHAKADVTQVYAERDLSLATEVVRKIG